MPFRTPENYREEIAALERQLAHVLGAKGERLSSIDQATRRVRMLETMLETVPVGVVIAEAPSGRIVMGNARVEELVRHPVLHSDDTQSYGEWVAYHADGRRVDTADYPLAKIIENNLDHAQLDVHYQCGDGVRRWLRIIGRPVRDDNDHMIGAAVVMIDIEPERQMLAQKETLIGELNHRVKNMFAVVQSIVSQTLRNEGVDSQAQDKISARLDAYARAHAQLLSLSGGIATISVIAKEVLNGFIGDDQITFSGPNIDLPERKAMALSMALFELATNAQKYGALSVDTGKVDLSWEECADRQLRIRWTETGGPTPQAPSATGFGSFVLNRALSMQMRGEVNIQYPATGLIWELKAPLSPPGG